LYTDCCCVRPGVPVRYHSVRYHSGGSMKLNACTVSCFLHTWFIYNLNTILLLARHTHNNTIYTGLTLHESTWHNPLDNPLVNPLGNPPSAWITLPCSRVPLTYLESLLCVWCDPCPLWSQVACKLTSPPPGSLPMPISRPQWSPMSIVCPSTTTSQPRLHIVWYRTHVHRVLYTQQTISHQCSSYSAPSDIIIFCLIVSHWFFTCFHHLFASFLKENSSEFFHKPFLLCRFYANAL
jgi:hypothetical protein